MIEVDIRGKRIVAEGWIGPDTPDRLKSIAGSSFAASKKVWTFPLTWRTCIDLRAEFGDQLQVGAALDDWGWAERERRERLEAIRTGVEPPVLEALLARTPRIYQAVSRDRPFQGVGVAWLSAARRGILADQPGLGKTVQLLGAFALADLKGAILVLSNTPAATDTWPEEIAKWAPNDRFTVLEGARNKRTQLVENYFKGMVKEPDNRHWLMCNYEMLRTHARDTKDGGKAGQPAWPFLFEIDWHAIVADEAQKCLITRTSKRNEQSLQRRGAGELTIWPEGFKIALSGTPWRGRPENNWGTLNWLFPSLYTSYWSWVQSYFEIGEVMLGGTVPGQVVTRMMPDRKEAYMEDLRSVMLRRTKVEVASDLPPKMYAGWPLKEGGPAGIWLDMGSKQKSAYEQMKRDAVANLDSGTIWGNGTLSELTRLRQFACSYMEVIGEEQYNMIMPSNKFDWLVYWLDKRGICHPDDAYGEDKVIVASQFTRLIELFADGLGKMGIEVLQITGKVKGEQRRNNRRIFQSAGGPRVLMLNTQAGGSSLTLDAADDMVILDETWDPDDQEQLEDRIDRLSRIHTRNYWYVRSKGTIEESIAMQNMSKDMIQKSLLDGWRGVALAKQILGVG